MKKFVLTMMLATVAGSSMAQNSAINKARTLFDESVTTEEYKDENGQKKLRTAIDWKKVEEAQNMLTPTFTNEKTKNFVGAWNLQGDIYYRYYAVELQKAIDGEPLDTVKLYNLLSKTLDAYYEVVKIDTKGETKKLVQPNFMRFRPYFLNCGQLLYQCNRYDYAYDAFDSWFDYPNRYNLAGEEALKGSAGETNKNQIAFFAALCAYNAKMYDKMDKYKELAFGYEDEAATARGLYMQALMEKGDTLAWEQMGEEMVFNGTAPEGTLQNILNHYMTSQKTDKLKAFAQNVCDKNPDDKWGPFAMGVIMQNEEKWVESADWFKKAIELDPIFVDAIRGAALATYQQALDLYSKLPGEFKTTAERDKAEAPIKEKCQEAADYFEQVRGLVPEKANLWAYNLRTIYTILGQKDKVDEVSEYCDL